MPEYNLGTARGRIEIDQTGLKTAASGIQKFQTGLSRSFTSIGKSLTSAGKTMTKGLTLPIVAFGAIAVKSFVDAEKVIAETEAVIKSTGGVANVTAGDVARLAEQVMLYSGFSDEAVASGANMLLTFKNIRNEAGQNNDIFNQSVEILADMSRFFDQDMKTSAIRLGKALNDPVKGITALTRVGVTFTEQEANMVAKMVDAGKTMEAQKFILAELTSEFGGQARAFGQTTAGQFEIMKQRMDNAMEDIGKVIVELGGPIMMKLAEGLTRLLESFNKLSPGTKEFIIKMLAAAAAIGPLLIIIGSLLRAIGAIIPVVRAVGFAITAAFTSSPILLVVAAIIGLAIIIVKNWTTIKNFLIGVWNTIKNAALQLWRALPVGVRQGITTILNLIKAGFNLIVSIIQLAWKLISTVTKAIWRVIGPYVKAGIGIITTVIKAGVSVIKGIWSTFWNLMKTFVIGPIRAIIGFVTNMINVIKDAINYVKDLIPGGSAIKEAFAFSKGFLIGIPPNARGDRNFQGGLTLVGERGPELALLPKGSQIFPAHETRRMLAGLKSSPASVPMSVSSKAASSSGLSGLAISGSLEMIGSEAVIRGVVVQETEQENHFNETVRRMRRNKGGR